MGAKDITEKELIALNDVFSDIVNALLFSGKPVVQPERLEPAAVASVYQGENRLREQVRDQAKFWLDCGGIRIALIGIENETQPENEMVFRVFGYDGAGYRAQIYLEKDAKGKYRVNSNARYPVVTLVLYFDYKRRWTAPKSLYEALPDMPKELKPFVNDYKLNLFELAWLSDAEAALFQSDFRFVVDYVRQMRKNESYQPPEDEIVHVRELLNLMSVLTGDDRFSEVNNIQEAGREVHTMCEVLDRVEQRGYENGFQSGEQAGYQNGYQSGEQAGYRSGEQAGYQSGEQAGKILGSVSVYREELGLDNQAIIDKIALRFSLTKDEASSFVLSN